MGLSIDEVKRIAHLARLRLSPLEQETFAPQLAQIIDYVDQLKAYPSKDAAFPTSQALEADDVPGSSMSRELFLANAPDRLDPFIVVPQVKTTGDE